MLVAAVRLLRPSHWLKNVFVFVPLVYSKALLDGASRLKALEVFVLFCMVSSAVYVFNDIADRRADAEHPEKRDRPIPSGAIQVSTAWVIFAILLLGSIGLAVDLPWRATLLVSVYFVFNVAYSLGLKHVVLIDIFIIAAGFMLRVLAGGYAIEVPITSWLVICTLFLSLFLGIAKRRSELGNVDRGNSRRVLDDYTPELIRTIMIVSVAGSILSYTLYTASDHVVQNFGTDKLIYTVPIVMYGMFRYLYLDEKRKTAENPVAVFARDPSLLVTGLVWIAASLAIIYLES